MRRTELERFIALMIGRGLDDCWHWPAARDTKGRGMFSLSPPNNSTPAHRWLFQQAVGPLWEDELLTSACGTPDCVNPAHMEITDQRAVAHRNGLARKLRRIAIEVFGEPVEKVTAHE